MNKSKSMKLNYGFYNLYGGGGTGVKQWDVLIHNGPMFAPLYEPHNIPVIINNNKYQLSGLAEEYITMYARYINTEYTTNPKISNRFNKNFLNDWKKVLPKHITINNMSEVDVADIKKHLDKIKEQKANITKEEKDKIKQKNDELEEPYKYCMVNGGRMKVGNYKIEPPGIFLGRGDHPKLGCIKKRINPEDVIINLSKDAPISKPNVSGSWGKVIHNDEVVWLATWTDNISSKNKYVFTSMESIFKSKSDMDKFDLARKLKKKVNQIRSVYYEDMKGTDEIKQQLATALYLIDNLALRVGGTKDTKEQADTVGVTSLRVEHIIINNDNHNDNIIKLDFLGKDSVRYCRKVKIDEVAYNNIKSFINNKNKKNDLFDKISSASLNNYLNNLMEGLTAKVWRTYNASMLFQKELDKVNPAILEKIPESEKINYLMSIFNQANTAVALLCNHQKNVSSDIEKSVKQIEESIKKYKKRKQKTKDKEKIKLIEAKIINLKMKKETKVKMKNVSLGTSKNNYIDPRIIFAFIKKYNIPEDKLFNKGLITRFDWAKKEGDDYRF
jgi:DNA topoisomerase-1